MFDPHVAELDRNAGLMTQEASRRLYSYWNRLRGTRTAPERWEIDPSQIANILGDTFILQVDRFDRLPFRLAGTRLTLSHGRELKGENWLEGWSDSDQQALQTLLNCVIEDVVGAVVAVEHTTQTGRTIQYEWVLFPVSLPKGPICRILGIATPLEHPYWLNADPLMRKEIADVNIIWLNRSWDRHRTPDMRLMANGSTPKSRYGHLALYDGGRID